MSAMQGSIGAEEAFGGMPTDPYWGGSSGQAPMLGAALTDDDEDERARQRNREMSQKAETDGMTPYGSPLAPEVAYFQQWRQGLGARAGDHRGSRSTSAERYDPGTQKMVRNEFRGMPTQTADAIGLDEARKAVAGGWGQGGGGGGSVGSGQGSGQQGGGMPQPSVNPGTMAYGDPGMPGKTIAGLRIQGSAAAGEIARRQQEMADRAALPGQSFRAFRTRFVDSPGTVGGDALRSRPTQNYENFGNGVEFNSERGGWKGLTEQQKQAGVNAGIDAFGRKHGLSKENAPSTPGGYAAAWQDARGSARRDILGMGGAAMAADLRRRATAGRIGNEPYRPTWSESQYAPPQNDLREFSGRVADRRAANFGATPASRPGMISAPGYPLP